MADKNLKNIDNAEEKETKAPKMYEDYKSFQGISFENNINSINHLFFGQGLKISDIPFIIKEENSDKNILAVNQINIKSSLIDKTICYPKKCIHIVFYHENSIFYLTKNNTLEIYKLESNKIIKHTIPHIKDTTHEIVIKDINNYNLQKIFKAIKGINEQNSVLHNYEILFNILRDDLKLNLEKCKSRKKNETLTFNFTLNSFEYLVEIKTIEVEVDGVGMIREQLNVKKGKISLKEGINSVVEYANLKNEKNAKAKEFINNSFKCPIIYKNFDEDIIPENKTILIEIKSGFDILGVKAQINSRINIINDCLFKQGEKPTFYIGLINLDSNKIKDLIEYNKDVDFNIGEKALIISCIDYDYCEIDLSYEVNNDYLLYKELKNLEAKIDNTKKDLENKIDNSINGLETKINKKFDSLIEALQAYSPGINIRYSEILRNKTKEEKKDSN